MKEVPPTGKDLAAGGFEKGSDSMQFDIPGFGPLDIRHLVLDFNGTLATDGIVAAEVRSRLKALAEGVAIHVITADTRGNAARELAGLPVSLETSGGDRVADFKRAVVEELGQEHCVSVGNGRNDLAMFQVAALSIAVAGPEGLYPPLLHSAHLMVPSMADALQLLLDPRRLIASLRG